MRVLVACEFSGIVRDAFIARGHKAISCDLLPSERPGPHIEGPIEDVDFTRFDLMIAHPPCTDLAVSGARYFKEKIADGRQQRAIEFCEFLWTRGVPKIALENPVGVLSTKSSLGKPSQIIQPYHFGHPESKKTCLWLKGLPILMSTQTVEPIWMKNPDGTEYRDSSGQRYSPTHYLAGRQQVARWANTTPSGQNNLPPSPDRWKLRSRTYKGIAAAMAEQWGSL